MKTRVLIIEDEMGIIESVGFAFKLYWPEAELVAATHGMRGVEIVKAGGIDAIILDLGLPDMDGFEVLKEIRLISSIPVIVLTVHAKEDGVTEDIELEANDYVLKPFRQKDLIAHIQSHLVSLNT